MELQKQMDLLDLEVQGGNSRVATRPQSGLGYHGRYPGRFFYTCVNYALEVRTARNTGVGDHVTDIRHSGYIGNQAFKTQSEARMRYGSIAP